MRARYALLVALALPLAACARSLGPDVATVTPPQIHAIDASEVQGPFVQAGTRAVIVLDEPIDTAASAVGQPFTAHLASTLRAPDGTVVAPKGARVTGRVVSTGAPSRPRLRLLFDTVATDRGPATIDGVVLRAQSFTYPGREVRSPVGAPLFADDYTYSYDFMDYGTAQSRRPGSAYAYEEAYPREIHVPRGARMAIELTRPVLPPGTAVRR